jgi:hypothetical protein
VTTPDKIFLLSSKKTAVSQSVLLTVKVIVVPDDPSSGIFTVRGKEFKGFQYGTPPISPKRLRVELFPRDGHLDLLFTQKENGPTVISQADINRIVQIIHKAPVEAAGKDADVSNM